MLFNRTIKLQSHRHDGFITQWYHKSCFFMEFDLGSNTTADIDGFQKLRNEDQIEIRENLCTKL